MRIVIQNSCFNCKKVTTQDVQQWKRSDGIPVLYCFDCKQEQPLSQNDLQLLDLEVSKFHKMIRRHL